MMTATADLQRAGILESKSQIVDLRRKIQHLMKRYYDTGDHAFMARAAELSRQKENLLKPASMRTSRHRARA